MEKKRLNPRERKRSLIRAAARIMEKQGVDAVRIPAVASASGVSRPVVYAHFKNRQEIILAILEDYREDLAARFTRALENSAPDLESAVEAVLIATCDAIEAKGTGAWNLLGAKGPDPLIEKKAQQIRRRLRKPWFVRIQEATKAGETEALALTHMTGMVTRGLIDLWIQGKLKKEEAVEIGIKGVVAMLRAFRGAG
jgi:AcrR family transcriptional regulator